MRRSLVAVLLVVLGCEPGQPNSQATWAPPVPSADAKGKSASAKPAPSAAPAAGKFGTLDRTTFNRAAARLNQPVYWMADANKNKAVDPGEVAALEFFPTRGEWVKDGKFTPAFEKVYGELVLAAQTKSAGREGLVQAELDGADAILVRTDLKAAAPADKAFVAQMLVVSGALDELYAVQSGSAAIADKVAKDPGSQSLFRRNWGPSCKTPKLEKDTACSALVEPGAKQPVAVWPAALQEKDDFCKTLEKKDDWKELSKPFTAVKADGDKLVPEGYEKTFGAPMKKVAEELRKAASLLPPEQEKPFIEYLEAAAKGFETNDWEPVDEAWSKMSATNSRYYLRIAPDETYWEPCSIKAGFHMSFALINKESLELQKKLTEHQQAMEDELAKLIGESYKPNKVSFKLPDFIDVIVNAGDSRDAIGATIGQSLPNWGKVAKESRGRTVAMTNLYSDPDSAAVRRKKAESLLVADAMKSYVDQGGGGLLGTVLHEATHNLGPSHEYEANGKKDDEAFGGDLASMLEELKAQSGAYYYLYLLQEKGVFTEKQVAETILDNLVWSMNHVSRGMYAPNGQRKAYSQLAAIHLGFFLKEGAITWDPNAKAANGTDTGAFSVDLSKMKAASIALMKAVGTIKAKGDKKAALELADAHVEKDSKVPMAIITERMLRFPAPTFVYSVEL
jgi:hypothetical protein